jgi:hypothetical protein
VAADFPAVSAAAVLAAAASPAVPAEEDLAAVAVEVAAAALDDNRIKKRLRNAVAFFIFRTERAYP